SAPPPEPPLLPPDEPLPHLAPHTPTMIAANTNGRRERTRMSRPPGLGPRATWCWEGGRRYGGPPRNRTGMPRKAADFESAASASSARGPLGRRIASRCGERNWLLSPRSEDLRFVNGEICTSHPASGEGPCRDALGRRQVIPLACRFLNSRHEACSVPRDPAGQARHTIIGARMIRTIAAALAAFALVAFGARAEETAA